MCLLGVFGLTIGGGFLGAIVTLVVAAVILILAAKIIPGFEKAGFGGAVISVITIAVVFWLVGWVVSLFT